MERNAKNKGFRIRISKKTKIVIYALLTVTVALLIVFTAAQKLGNITINTMTDSARNYVQSMGSGEGFPYSLNGKNVRDITINDSNLLLLFDDRTVLLTPTAKEIMPQEHKYSTPVMKSNGPKTVVYDLDSGRFRIQNGSEIVKEYELKNKIMAAAVGKKGNYAVGTYGDDVQSVLTVYSSTHKKVFEWNFKSERICDISLSENGKFAAVAVIYSNNGKISSRLYVFNFGSDKPVSKFDYESSVLVKVDYVNGSDIAVVGDNVRSYIKNGKEKTDTKDFNSDTLHNYCISDDGRSALVLSKYGSSSLSSLTVYSDRNREQFSLNFDSEIEWVDCGEKYTAVLFGNEVKTYNKKGRQIGSISFSGEPVRVAVDGSKVYILTSVKLICCDIKGSQKAG